MARKPSARGAKLDAVPHKPSGHTSPSRKAQSSTQVTPIIRGKGFGIKTVTRF